MASTEDRLAEFLSGVVAKGYAWSGTGPVDTTQTPMHGFVRLGARGSIEFEAFDLDDPYSHSDPFDRQAPPAVALTTPLGGAVLVDVRQNLDFSLQFGGTRESVIRLRSDSLLFGVDVAALNGLSMTATAVRFEGLGLWAGLRSLKTTPSTDTEGHLTGLSVSIGGAERPDRQEATHRLPGSLALSLDEHWSYRGTSNAGIAISTALELGLRAGRARPVAEFLTPILDIQDLLSLMYRGWVPAAPGRVTLKDYSAEQPLLWNRIAMHHQPRAIDLPSNRRSLLGPSQLGGVEGVARWIDVCQDFRTSVDAVAAAYREGPESTAALLLKVGAAIEQYVAAHARTTTWASRKTHGTHELALATRVGGPAFARWSGDPKKWADRFHATYLSSKHLRGGSVSAQDTDLFARGGRWLLLAALLDRIALSKTPSRQIFTSGDQAGLGRATQHALGIT